MKKFLKHNGFTLSEVLLTLIIIGVISALTVPTLKNHSEEAKYVSAVQKAYESISAATINAEIAHGDAALWNFKTSNTLKWYKESMSTVPITGETSWSRFSLNGTKATFKPNVMTADGMAWEIHDGGYSCGGGCALVDVNGSAPPNTVGIDIHGFRIGNLCKNGKKTGEFGVHAMGDHLNDANDEWACTAYIIKHKKMPWLYKPSSGCNEYGGK